MDLKNPATTTSHIEWNLLPVPNLLAKSAFSVKKGQSSSSRYQRKREK
jgi:hypothetical protein